MTGVTPSPERPGATADAAAGNLAAALWLERDLLDRLLFALTSQQLVLRAGVLRWLAATDAQVQQAVDALSDCELRRAIASSQLAQAFGLGEDATLNHLAQAAPEPWGMLLADHRDSLRALAAEIATTTAENKRMLQAGSEATREALARVGSTMADHHDAVAYGFRGRLPEDRGPVLIDERA